MIGAAGGGLAATGFGAAALPLTSALAAKLVVAGAITAAAGLAAGAAANVMESRGSGGGGGSGGGRQFKPDTPQEKSKMADDLMKEHKGEKGGRALTRTNADNSLNGPKGTKARLPKTKDSKTPDIEFVDEYGAVKLRREVKATSNKDSFESQVAEGSEQVQYQGEVFVQVPNNVTAAEARSWMANFQKVKTDSGRLPNGLGKYKGVNVRIVRENGQELGYYNAGKPLPAAPPEPPPPTPPRRGPRFI
jgi:hypothetical protein